MLLRQLFDRESSSFTYLVADPATGEAALVDPVLEQVDRDLGIVADLGLILRYAMDTHVHADHVTGGGELRRRTGCRTVAGPRGASCADLHLEHGETLLLGDLVLEVISTPGHTDDSVCYRVGDDLFTGDTLFVRGNGRTDFQNGDPGLLYDSITTKLFTLPEPTRVWPGHDYRGCSASTIGEERRLNPRLAGKSRDEFIAIMRALHLPAPAKIDTAVAANRACGELGRPGAEAAPVQTPAAPVDEIDPAQLPAMAAARIVDVRESDEFNGELGHLPGAELVPLARLAETANAWDRGGEIVVVCQTGRRSRDAAARLTALGFSRVHALRGGMRAVRQRA